jgi:hypothetical protein
MKTDNELIAEFMGYERSREVWDEGEHAYTMKIPQAWNKWVTPSKMQYSTSWDWIMPVVGKIEKMEFEVDVQSQMQTVDDDMYTIWHQDCTISDGVKTYAHAYSRQKLTAVYMAVVEFIKWYNSQKQ